MRPYISGLVAAFGLLGLYATTMTVLSGWPAAVEQFRALWYLMLPLAAGFGVQVGLYTKLVARGAPPWRGDLSAEGIQSAQAPVAAGGTSAGVSMLACCSHHASDVLPFLGLSGVSIFLTRYQIPLLAVSLAINVVGITVMIKHLRKMY